MKTVGSPLLTFTSDTDTVAAQNALGDYTIELNNSSGVPIASQSVAWTVSDDLTNYNAVVGSASGTTNAQGRATTTVRLDRVGNTAVAEQGTITLTATIGVYCS